MATDDITELSINTIRALSMDAVQQANSGHPGAPMGLAPAGYLLFQRHMRHNPANTDWANRDRFILSNGHASMLQYSLLHLTGYPTVTLDEIKRFRQWGSCTPGHPENFVTPGVEVTTGPLGQGFSTAVGMALAEAHLNERYDGVIDHFTYVICSDGDLMEGVTAEAASLAGHLGLGKLICIFDDNEITIDGRTDLAFTEDVLARFEAYGWHTDRIADGNDIEGLDRAINDAKAITDRPSLISLRTVIGYGSPNKADKSAAHGSPLGDDEIARAKENLGWPYTERFVVPDEVREHMDARESGQKLEAEWKERFEAYRDAQPERADELARRLSGELADGWDADLPDFEPSDKGMATRAASGKVLERLFASLPGLMGGSADLAGSNKTLFADYGIVAAGHYDAQNIHFGVREHAMCAIANGLTLHGGCRGFCATFLIFSDYMRAALRLAALMGTPTIGVFTHDSIGLGEDGPTHQPVEHLASLRAMPNMAVFRPGDANEVRACWKTAIERTDGPSSLALTRQNVPTIDRSQLNGQDDASRGAYILADPADGAPEVILLATGSEVAIALDAWRQLTDDGVAARLVSMPCWEVFEAQDQSYRDKVLPRDVTARVSIEAATTFGWRQWVGTDGASIGLDRFGASAPYEVLYEKFGLTADHVVSEAKQLLEG